ncbi:probable serine/threonine-protein kinase samkC [Colossoma macropomum]|uniref:probable serine/threonine-protein kinase samkC n=1 Tax=Colossoma macropomum TaxID=42526 RepID=UPI0018655381|nr:probable serine/threonine-protein kinase samkC [Colossoma macropomum]
MVHPREVSQDEAPDGLPKPEQQNTVDHQEEPQKPVIRRSLSLPPTVSSLSTAEPQPSTVSQESEGAHTASNTKPEQQNTVDHHEEPQKPVIRRSSLSSPPTVSSLSIAEPQPSMVSQESEGAHTASNTKPEQQNKVDHHEEHQKPVRRSSLSSPPTVSSLSTAEPQPSMVSQESEGAHTASNTKPEHSGPS